MEGGLAPGMPASSLQGRIHDVPWNERSAPTYGVSNGAWPMTRHTPGLGPTRCHRAPAARSHDRSGAETLCFSFLIIATTSLKRRDLDKHRWRDMKPLCQSSNLSDVQLTLPMQDFGDNTL